MRSIVTCAVCVVLMTSAVAIGGGDDYAVREKAVVRPEVLPDKASVYVLRPAKMGMAIRMWAFADDTVLGLTKGDTYAHAYLDPGSYTFWGRAENVSAIDQEVEAGKTYYLKQSVKMGGLKARVKVEFLDDAEGLKALEKCKSFSKLTDAGRARAAEIAAEKQDVADEKADERAAKESGH
jgi:hypothetical protein